MQKEILGFEVELTWGSFTARVVPPGGEWITTVYPDGTAAQSTSLINGHWHGHTDTILASQLVSLESPIEFVLRIPKPERAVDRRRRRGPSPESRDRWHPSTRPPPPEPLPQPGPETGRRSRIRGGEDRPPLRGGGSVPEPKKANFKQRTKQET